jgi:hypothetical protein
MPLEFTRVTKENPCPICARDNWCEHGQRAAHCMRVESIHLAKDGGFYHFYGKTAYRPIVREIQPVLAPSVNVQKLWKNWYRHTSTEQYEECGRVLGVSAAALADLGAAWTQEYRAWAFPMFDGAQNIIGLRLRNNEGFKWTVRGSKNGIFTAPLNTEDNIAFIPEGPTDCAALLTLGLSPIGRPNNLSCFEMIKKQCALLGVRKVVIVSDNDELKTFGPTEARPGLQGALQLQKQIGLPSVIWMPPSPIKDARQFVREGGTQQMILDDLKSKVWLRK